MKHRLVAIAILTIFLSVPATSGNTESVFPSAFPAAGPAVSSTPGVAAIPYIPRIPPDLHAAESQQIQDVRTKLETPTPEGPLSAFEQYVKNLPAGGGYVSTDIRQFGYDLFRQPPSTFAPILNVPVGPGYILGPGDQIRITYWGSVNGEFAPVIDSEGKITLPYFGTLQLSGLTFTEAKKFLEKEFRRQYKPGQVKLNITTGRLRTIGVFVVGNARSPGSYTISSLSTLVSALFASGGPGKHGSMRDIQVRRNGELVARLDLYDFFLKGDKASDIRLMPEDVIFIPPVGLLAGIAGNVKSPAIFELKNENSLKDLIDLAGGLNDIAFTGRVQITRIQANNRQIVLEYNIDKQDPEDISIQSGDVVKIYPIVEDVRVVRLSGAVHRGGEYGISAGMTVKDLITLAGGLRYYAYGDEAELIRVTPTPKGPVTKKILLSPEKALADDPGHNLQLEPDDSLLIKAVPEWELYRQVAVSGEVKFPGTYTIKKGEKLSSLVERAGLTENSYLKGTVFTRESVRELQQRQLEEAIDRLEQQLLIQVATVTETALSAESAEQERIAAEQRRALLAKLRSARAKGRLALNFELVVNMEKFKQSSNDIVLEEGDSLYIPERPAQVQVMGAVYNQNAFVHDRKSPIDSYIKLSGGLTKSANKKEIYVLKVDGTAISMRETSNFMRKRLDPGDTIVVPEKIDKVAWLRNVKDITQILYQIAVTAAVVVVF
ncbi:MAG: SLBB domain-containing protein [bacterium]